MKNLALNSTPNTYGPQVFLFIPKSMAFIKFLCSKFGFCKISLFMISLSRY